MPEKTDKSHRKPLNLSAQGHADLTRLRDRLRARGEQVGLTGTVAIAITAYNKKLNRLEAREAKQVNNNQEGQ